METNSTTCKHVGQLDTSSERFPAIFCWPELGQDTGYQLQRWVVEIDTSRLFPAKNFPASLDSSYVFSVPVQHGHSVLCSEILHWWVATPLRVSLHTNVDYVKVLRKALFTQECNTSSARGIDEMSSPSDHAFFTPVVVLPACSPAISWMLYTI